MVENFIILSDCLGTLCSIQPGGNVTTLNFSGLIVIDKKTKIVEKCLRFKLVDF